jgi:translation elongation factor EF-1beta
MNLINTNKLNRRTKRYEIHQPFIWRFVFCCSVVNMTAPLPAYNLALDELRVALTYAGVTIDLTPVIPTPTFAPVTPASPVAAPAPAPAPAAKKAADDDDFDVFGDDEDGEAAEEAPKESRAEMLARLKKEAEERTLQKEAKQRTLVAIEIKPWDVEQDLMVLWKKITETITQDGLKWGENCNLADVAFGIKKIQTTFVMGVSNSSDDVVDAILALEDEVQSCEVTSMNVL